MKERFAAEAPARAAAKAAKAERRRAEKARAPPRTRASHPRPEFVLRALGGSKRAPDDAPPEKRARRPPARAPPQEAAAAPAAPASQTRDDFLWCDDFSVVLTYEEWHAAWHALEYPGGPDQ